MIPADLAKCGTEHGHQMAFFMAIREYQSAYPELAFMFAIPNGGERQIAVAGRLKSEGVKQGVPDVFLPYPSRGYHGLWLEFKRPKTGKQAKGRTSEAQILWAKYLISQNYSYFVAYNYLTAVEFTIDYLRSV